MLFEKKREINSVAISIRAVTTADAKEVASVHLHSYNDTYRGLLPDYFIDERNFDYRYGMWVAYLMDDLRFTAVAEVDGKVFGLVRYGRPEVISRVDATVGEVHKLYVLPDYQGQGVGSALLTYASEQLGELRYRSAILYVVKGNDDSLGFYEHQGWKAEGESQLVNFGGCEFYEVPLTKELGF